MENFFDSISVKAEIVSWNAETIFLRMETGAEFSWPYSRCTELFQNSLQRGKKVELILCDDMTFEEERTRIAKTMLNEILQSKV